MTTSRTACTQIRRTVPNTICARVESSTTEAVRRVSYLTPPRAYATGPLTVHAEQCQCQITLRDEWLAIKQQLSKFDDYLALARLNLLSRGFSIVAGRTKQLLLTSPSQPF